MGADELDSDPGSGSGTPTDTGPQIFRRESHQRGDQLHSRKLCIRNHHSGSCGTLRNERVLSVPAIPQIFPQNHHRISAANPDHECKAPFHGNRPQCHTGRRTHRILQSYAFQSRIPYHFRANALGIPEAMPTGGQTDKKSAPLWTNAIKERSLFSVLFFFSLLQ